LDPNVIPSAQEAAEAYCQFGRLSTEFEGDEADPLNGYEELQQQRDSILNLTEEEVARLTKEFNLAQRPGFQFDKESIDDGVQQKVILCINLTKYLSDSFRQRIDQ
jgi:hypothetical protein